jgi:transcriptional regulator with XRE-family HTH domain
VAQQGEAKLEGEAARMRGVRIRALLDAEQIRQVDLAAELGCTRASVSLAISGQSRSARIEAHIAARLGMSVKQLWAPVGPVALVNALTRSVAMSTPADAVDADPAATTADRQTPADAAPARPTMKVAAGA